jgi:hypothetical protein
MAVCHLSTGLSVWSGLSGALYKSSILSSFTDGVFCWAAVWVVNGSGFNDCVTVLE